MPAGLDGNPNPIATASREAVLSAVAERVLALGGDRALVAIDGRPGAGKSTFADELAVKVTAGGRHVLRSTTDSFHRPRSERMRLGLTSAEGYYLESHQLTVIIKELFEPFARGANTVLLAAFDEPSDSSVHETAAVDEPAVLIFDGLFLQRPEFGDVWDLVVFLQADRRLDQDWLDFLLADLTGDATNRAAAIDERLSRARWPRYRVGWSAYVEAVRPADRATVVIDNNDFAEPHFVRSIS